MVFVAVVGRAVDLSCLKAVDAVLGYYMKIVVVEVHSWVLVLIATGVEHIARS